MPTAALEGVEKSLEDQKDLIERHSVAQVAKQTKKFLQAHLYTLVPVCGMRLSIFRSFLCCIKRAFAHVESSRHLPRIV
jgi:hypothetical protein